MRSVGITLLGLLLLGACEFDDRIEACTKAGGYMVRVASTERYVCARIEIVEGI